MKSDQEVEEVLIENSQNTVTPNSLDVIPGNEEQECPEVWGRLYPRRVYLQPYDMVKKDCLFGKAECCDIRFSLKNMDKKSLTLISKVHLRITYEKENVFIEDLSKNGTFVNNVCVGRGKTLLQNDDEISIGVPNLHVYVFKQFKNEEEYLPPGLKSKFAISRLLGAGAFGEVKLAFKKTTGEQFAIKRIVKGRTSLGNCNPLSKKTDILNEVRILKSLAHPFIISMHEMMETDAALFIVLEYMEGGELEKHILSRDQPLTEGRAKLIFYQIVLGVQYLHKQDITHRDLKPANILLKTNELETLVKVSDFGLSKIVHDNVFMETICGTPMYVAPEVLDVNCRTYTKQIDIWSIGVILFYMLSKELPFKTKLYAELVRLILNCEYEINETAWRAVSGNAMYLVKRMLIRDPQKRIEIEDVAKHPWLLKDGNMHDIVTRLIKESKFEKTTIFIDNLQRQEFEETMAI